MVRRKSRLLVSDLDNTLFAPAKTPTSNVKARSFLKTFLRYVLHPESPYQLAIWTFSGRIFGIAHLRSLGVGDLLFADDELLTPELRPGVAALWGYEDTELESSGKPAFKDLQQMWDFLNVRRPQGQPEFGAWNSCIVDDQFMNANEQPHSLILAPLYTWKSPDDDFLLQLVGFLDEISTSSNFVEALDNAQAAFGLNPDDGAALSRRGLDVCKRLNIPVEQVPQPLMGDSRHVELVRYSPLPGPEHDSHPGENHAHLGIVPLDESQTPPRIAKGMTLAPSNRYWKEVAEPSSIGGIPTPLIIFDLDGTLYHRPPTVMEHHAGGIPCGRPYLHSVLNWILNYSGWRVAIWTGSLKSVAVSCLNDLNLGIVGPRLIGPRGDQADIRHPNLVALWAREDFGLTTTDFNSWVAVVKDLDKLWDHLERTGVGHWSSYDTLMVDDTPSKLRAQPDTLIFTPTFNYPPESNRATARGTPAQDTFLLELVGAMDLLSYQTNFANFIREHRWLEDRGRSSILVKRGVTILKQAGVGLDPESHDPIPVPAQAGSRSRLGLSTSMTALRRRDNLESPTPSPSTTSTISTDSELEPAPPARRTRGHLQLPADSGREDPAPRFVREMEALRLMHHSTSRLPRRLSSVGSDSDRERLEHAVEDWEALSDSSVERSKRRANGTPRL